CPIIGISGRNSAPSLVSVAPPIIGISGRNSAPSLVSVGVGPSLVSVAGIIAPSLVSVGGI
ncbi:unnamed protein product, partial [Staurois parvus]